MTHAHFTLPRLTALAWRAIPRLLEGVVAPLAIFYAGLLLLGLNGALGAALLWVYVGVGWRLVRRRPVPGTMIMAALAITLRTALAFWSESAVVYFIQPELGTICISAAFLISLRLRRPLVERLILDYVPLPSVIVRHERMRRFIARITVLWAFTLLCNSTVSIWLLLHETIGTYLIVRTSAVAVISGLAIGISLWAFRRCLRHFHHHHAQPQPALSAATH